MYGDIIDQLVELETQAVSTKKSLTIAVDAALKDISGCGNKDLLLGRARSHLRQIKIKFGWNCWIFETRKE